MSRIKIQNVRIAFPSLWQKAQFGGEATKFEATFLVDKSDTETVKRINAAINAKLLEKFKSKDKIPPGIKTEAKCCFRDGDNVSYDGFKDHYSVKAANKVRPSVVDRAKNPVTEEDGLVYAGCYVDAVIDFWIQDNQYGKKVNANLYAVQFRAEGEPFGAGSVPEGVLDDFDDLDDQDTDHLDADEFENI